MATRIEGRRRSPEHLDRVDVQSLAELTNTRGWRIFARRLRETHAGKMRDLAKPQTEVETARLRGMLQGLELALRIPAILCSEAKVKLDD